jgi:His-Xaa-Ser system radical SAM maturase HxsC
MGRMKPLALSGRINELTWDLSGPTHVVLRLQERPEDCASAHDALLVRAGAQAPSCGFTAVAVGDGACDAERLVRVGEEFDYLRAGDVVAVHAEGRRLRTLYRRASRHNSLLTTERCNHYCLMCSQPPKNVDDSWLLTEIAAAIPLIDPATVSLGFTGGEPLLAWERFTDILRLTREHLPDTAIHVLTNGRGFAAAPIVDAWAAVGHANLCAGIPIYSAVDHVHDLVVQSKGAWHETVLGVLRMKDRGQRVEIRVVLHSLTAPRVPETARWIARNLPFVDHVALMGLENTGFAIANHELLWMDPLDYRAELAAAVEVLDAAKIRTSVYNLPFCVLERSVWPFAAQSISDWKNAYLPECDGCAAKAGCAGFFSSGRPRQSRGVEPLRSFALA